MKPKFFKAICYLLIVLIPYTSFAQFTPEEEARNRASNIIWGVLILGSVIGIVLWYVVEETTIKQKRDAGKLVNLELGMGKLRVRHEVLGEPSAVRGSIINKHGQRIEVWEYDLYKEGSNYCSSYWLYFCDGWLVQWGRAGDWRTEADRIYEMRFR